MVQLTNTEESDEPPPDEDGFLSSVLELGSSLEKNLSSLYHSYQSFTEIDSGLEENFYKLFAEKQENYESYKNPDDDSRFDIGARLTDFSDYLISYFLDVFETGEDDSAISNTDMEDDVLILKFLEKIICAYSSQERNSYNQYQLQFASQ